MKKNLVVISLLTLINSLGANPTPRQLQKLSSISVQNFCDDLDFIVKVYGNQKLIKEANQKPRGTDNNSCTSITFPELENGIYHINITRKYAQQLPSVVSAALSYIVTTRSPRTFVKSTDDLNGAGSDELWWNEQLNNLKIIIKLTSRCEQRHIVGEYISDPMQAPLITISPLPTAITVPIKALEMSGVKQPKPADDGFGPFKSAEAATSVDKQSTDSLEFESVFKKVGP